MDVNRRSGIAIQHCGQPRGAYFLTAGMWWSIGRRQQGRMVSDPGRRIGRTLINNMEGLTIFVPLIAVVELAGATSPTTALAAQAYLLCRVVFAGLYIGNVPYLRTFVWLARQAALLTLALAIVSSALA